MAATCPSTHAGTEDGHIHKCSTSYSEQYLETYHGHIGPVYALQWSPFNPSLFLSCSADWTIRMWQEGRQQPLMTFQSSNKEVRANLLLVQHASLHCVTVRKSTSACCRTHGAVVIVSCLLSAADR